MRRFGFRPDSALYDAVLNTCVSKNMLLLADEVLAEREAEPNLWPTCMTLVAVVRLHGARGALDRALQAFEDFPHRYGFEPDARAYHALISTCVSSGCLDDAFDAFASMSRSGHRASAKTYELLISASRREGALDRSVQLIQDALGLPQASSSSSISSSLRGPGAAADPAAPSSTLPQQRVLLEQRVVEGVLELVGRRRQASRLGLPLLRGLEEAGFPVSEHTTASLQRAAAAEATARAGASMSASNQRELRSTTWACWCGGFERLPQAGKNVAGQAA